MAIKMDTIKTNTHTWEIKRRTRTTGAAPYLILRDGTFWSTADSYRDAMDEIEEAENEADK